MNKPSLHDFTIDELLTQLVAFTNEVAEMHKRQEDKETIRVALKLIQLIQQTIIEKRKAGIE